MTGPGPPAPLYLNDFSPPLGDVTGREVENCWRFRQPVIAARQLLVFRGDETIVALEQLPLRFTREERAGEEEEREREREVRGSRARISRFKDTDPRRSFLFRRPIRGYGGEILSAQAVTRSFPAHLNLYHAQKREPDKVYYLFKIQAHKNRYTHFAYPERVPDPPCHARGGRWRRPTPSRIGKICWGCGGGDGSGPRRRKRRGK